MIKTLALLMLCVIGLSITGCQSGEVDAKAAESSYKAQEEKAKALDAKAGEKPVKEEGQGD